MPEHYHPPHESPEKIISRLLTPQPEIVVVSGGPCAGKTTLLDRLPALAAEQGRPLVILPEVATTMMQQGANFAHTAQHDRQTYLALQRALIQTEVDFIAQARATYAGTDTLIVMDRGISDVFAYVTPEEAQALALEFNASPHELGYDAADKVVYLSSVAVHSPEVYASLKSTNASRYESVEAAAATCRRTLAQWAQHPELHLADGRDFEDTIRRAAQYCLGGDQEYEQKWQLSPHAAQAIIAAKAEAGDMLSLTQITQSYGTLRGVPFRLRHGYTQDGYEYYHFAIKEKTAQGNRETRRHITATAYHQLSRYTEASLRKVRYAFRHEGQIWQADVMPDGLGEVWHFEAEVAHPDDFATLTIPGNPDDAQLTCTSARDIAYNRRRHAGS